MGAWGVGVYDNDNAADWVWELESDGFAAIESAFAKAEPRRPSLFRRRDDSFTSWDGACAVAAVEVVARLVSGGGEQSAYCEEVVAWVAQQPGPPSATLVDRARRVLAEVRGPRSELAELWAETDDHAAWLATLDEIEHRLG